MKRISAGTFKLMLSMIKTIETNTRQLKIIMDEAILTPAQEAEIKKQLGGDR